MKDAIIDTAALRCNVELLLPTLATTEIFLEASAAINHRYLSVCGKQFFFGKKVGLGFFVIREKRGRFLKILKWKKNIRLKIFDNMNLPFIL